MPALVLANPRMRQCLPGWAIIEDEVLWAGNAQAHSVFLCDSVGNGSLVPDAPGTSRAGVVAVPENDGQQ